MAAPRQDGSGPALPATLVEVAVVITALQDHGHLHYLGIELQR